MASTFSQTLRLELIGDGDQSGIWGQTTNTNLGTLLEQSITGVVSITMTDANYTLTNFNGVSDEARNAVLVVGGTNAAVRDIITPLVEKLYVVRNNTSGGFAVNIRASSGSSVSVPNGATIWVYCDGTNFNAVGTESVGNFEVNGNLTVTGNETVSGNSAVTGTTTLTGATTLSNALTYGGTTLANSVTGTGSMALSASPTFTGTPLAPTAAATTNNTQIATTAFVRSIIPAGVILMWSGSIVSIPTGWLLCDGTNGTPNLRDRFIVGAGSTYAVAATGGATSVTLGTTNLPSHTHSLSASGTTSTTDINHTHSFSATTSGQSADHNHSSQASKDNSGLGDPGNSGTYTNSGAGGGIATTGTSNDHNHTVSGNTGFMNSNNTHNHTVTVTGTSGATGSGTAFSILPTYYALAYIMKS
jgi:microcystin-dependent protein